MQNKKVKPSAVMKGMRFYTVEDLAEILPLTKLGVRDYLRKDKIPAVKVGVRWFVSEKNLSDFLLCKSIRDMPDDRIVDTVNKMVELAFNDYIDNKIVPLIKDVIRESEQERVKINLKKVTENNKQFSGRIAENLKRRTEKVKKDFEIVKKT